MFTVLVAFLFPLVAVRSPWNRSSSNFVLFCSSLLAFQSIGSSTRKLDQVNICSSSFKKRVKYTCDDLKLLNLLAIQFYLTLQFAE